MPTLPPSGVERFEPEPQPHSEPQPEPQPEPQSEPHRYRRVAESFGADAERYDRSRPRYPDDLVRRIITASAAVSASASPDVLDVGCGTGIAARQFRAAGARVLGVDVDARMADLARRSGLEVEVAAFEAWDPAGREFDAVIAGQTWHWVDPVAGATKAAQVLRPNGRLSVFWNVAQPPTDVADALGAVYRWVIPEAPVANLAMPALAAYSALFTKAADGMRATGAFGDPEQWRFDWDRLYTRAEWLDQLPTHGGYSQFPPSQQEELQAGIGAAIDAVGGRFTMHYSAVVVTAVRGLEGVS